MRLSWRSPTSPHSHQIAFKSWRRGGVPGDVKHIACLYEAGLGLGKTLSAIEEILELLKHRPRAQILVLARNSNLHTVWADELQRHAPGLPFTILDGKRTDRRSVLELDQAQQGAVWVHSREDLPGKLPDGTTMGKLLSSFDWDMVVVDECAGFRTASAKRTRFLTGQRHPTTKEWDAGLNADYKMAMSGLPVIKGAADLYPILRWLGIWPGTKAEFQQAFLFLDERGQEIMVKDLAGLRGLLASCRFQVPKNTVLNIPRTWRYDRLQMPAWQRASYKRIQNELKTNFTDADGVVHEGIIRSRLTELLRLAQVTAGFEAIDRERWNWRDDNVKTQHLLQVIMPELQGQRTILWGVFQPEVENLTRLLNKSGYAAVSYYGSGPQRDKENQCAWARWKGGGAKVFVSTLAKGSLGLNLPEASAMVFHSRDFNTEYFTQGLERNARLTTTHGHLAVVVEEVEDSVDEKVTQVLGDDLHLAASLTSVNLKEVLGR